MAGIFVQGPCFFRANIPVGTYDLWIAGGDTWHDEQGLFGSSTICGKSPDSWDFDQEFGAAEREIEIETAPMTKIAISDFVQSVPGGTRPKPSQKTADALPAPNRESRPRSRQDTTADLPSDQASHVNAPQTLSPRVPTNYSIPYAGALPEQGIKVYFVGNEKVEILKNFRSGEKIEFKFKREGKTYDMELKRKSDGSWWARSGGTFSAWDIPAAGRRVNEDVVLTPYGHRVRAPRSKSGSREYFAIDPIALRLFLVPP